jgi:hypothetical protein
MALKPITFSDRTSSSSDWSASVSMAALRFNGVSFHRTDTASLLSVEGKALGQ